MMGVLYMHCYTFFFVLYFWQMSKSFLVVLYTYNNNNNSVLYTNNTCVNGDHSSNQRPMAACIDNFMVKDLIAHYCILMVVTAPLLVPVVGWCQRQGAFPGDSVGWHFVHVLSAILKQFILDQYYIRSISCCSCTICYIKIVYI